MPRLISVSLELAGVLLAVSACFSLRTLSQTRIFDTSAAESVLGWFSVILWLACSKTRIGNGKSWFDKKASTLLFKSSNQIDIRLYRHAHTHIHFEAVLSSPYPRQYLPLLLKLSSHIERDR
jgi:hypothetical protein